MSASTATANNPFIKQLASSDRKTRDRALASLRTYLDRAAPFPPLELLKLWKGLYYSMWLADGRVRQQRLARQLAGLVDAAGSPANALGIMAAFWTTLARGWGSVDAVRMDKFLYLARCYVRAGFALVARRGWGDDEELLRDYLRLLEEGPLEPWDPRVPDGLRYHVLDVYVDELERVDPERRVPLERVLGPLRRLGRESPTKPLRLRAAEVLADERLADWLGDGDGGTRADEPVDDDTSEKDDEFGGFDD